MVSKTLIRYVVTAAIRDKLILGMCILLLMAVSLSMFMGSAAITEQDQFAAVFSAGSIRILNCLGLVLFVVFFIRRSFEGRDIEFLLSRPPTRLQIILSFAAGFSILAIVMGVISGLSVIALSPHLFSDGHILWITSLIIENIIMVNVALFFSMILTSAATGAFACFGFYVLSRMMSQLLGIIDSDKGIGYGHLQNIMEGVSMLMPRMDLMTQTSWLVYGAEGLSYGFLLFQGLIYCGVLITASYIDLLRRQF